MKTKSKELEKVSKDMKKEIQKAVLDKHAVKIPDVLDEMHQLCETAKDYDLYIDKVASLSGLERTKEIQQQQGMIQGATLATEAISGALQGLAAVFGGGSVVIPPKVVVEDVVNPPQVIVDVVDEEEEQEEPYDTSFLGDK